MFEGLAAGYNPVVSCEHRSPCIELREERRIIVCEACRTELVGWSLEVTLPFFLLERAEEEHAMWHLSRERGTGEESEASLEP